ncbi:DUF503 family protein [Heyndrickxia sporothermodurans]|uniref:DUF503 family protein n=1 Tax=Heyndrickxia sporothermodurans TaxID=46224 RepID=A0A150KPB7_9BACI|nr:DUF503 family protein [Heyndrickxia sporothermodurans]KYD00049.1 hypothetical protein B4102_1061 [Heyndrickxia sporothermodurans]MBL5768134.1 DUF503 family protein [Heyndrickxia sporothermodurans]MBL5771787.1 DUF503 family protein [Heyndrickxia sporothermodurans]MBL5775416.1 DUF503 family protein [Heyndrickxia sporothermodurans]MBL5779101.1 DUF503 family protein [Heyndrickxia sporothermodurans]
MIGYVECEFRIYEAGSLKEKRAVLQRVITRLKQKFNVSVSEIGHQDLWQRTKIAIVTVASIQSAAEREIENAIKFLDSFPEWERLETIYEWL